jgi:hypothetical protein
MSAERRTARDADRPRGPIAPQHCVVGEALREVVVLGEAEWAALSPGDRPAPAEYVPGLGWVCAV